MSSSPFINKELKKYILTNQIETKINNMLNKILKEQPQDPYALLALMVQQESSSEVTIKNLKAYEILNSDGIVTIQLDFWVEYLAQTLLITTNQGFMRQSENQSQILYDDDQTRFQGKGMTKACQLINSSLLHAIQNASLSNQKKFDDILNKFYLNNQYINLVQPISLQIPRIISIAKNEPLFQILRQSYQIQVPLGKSQIYVPILITNGKCKLQKLFIIFNQISQDLLKDITNITQSVKKTICSGKGGEASLKISPEGSYVCTSDAIMDNIKIAEDAIIQNGLKEICKIGLTFSGDSMWQADKSKYEVEGPKQIFDHDQMIDYYFKLCTEKPIIGYLEDPLLSTDQAIHQKMITKFASTSVKISCRKTFELFPNTNIHQVLYRFQDFKFFSNLYEAWKAITFKETPGQFILEGNFNECQDFSFIDVGFAFGCILSIAPPTKYERIQALNHYIQNCNQIDLS